jgi:hypothetical protein
MLVPSEDLEKSPKIVDRVQSEPVIMMVTSFAPQVFGWFQALRFESEGLPRGGNDYVEGVIRLPVTESRFDRVLIRTIVREVGLSDLNSFRQSVAHLQVDKVWLVTSSLVSQSVKQVLNKSEKGLNCLTFDELIDQFANSVTFMTWFEAQIRWQEMKISMNQWL